MADHTHALIFRGVCELKQIILYIISFFKISMTQMLNMLQFIKNADTFLRLHDTHFYCLIYR